MQCSLLCMKCRYLTGRDIFSDCDICDNLFTYSRVSMNGACWYTVRHLMFYFLYLPFYEHLVIIPHLYFHTVYKPFFSMIIISSFSVIWQVQESSTPARVKFKSKVFPSSFGAGLDVGPNTIDFGTVFDDGVKKLLENIHILVTILLFLVIYFTMLPFAVKKDREDRLNVSTLPYCTLLYSYEVIAFSKQS